MRVHINKTGIVMSRTFPKWLALFVWLLAPLSFGVLSVCLGQDANWDLRNYHFYNPYAFLNHRMGFDVLPGQVANFYNPLLYVPFYYMVVLLPPKMVGFILGVVQGLNFPLLWAVSRQLISSDTSDQRLAPPWIRELICIGVSLMGMLGAGGISELGTMFSDNILSLCVLTSLLIVLSGMKYLFASSRKTRWAVVMSAGFLTGAAAGFKQPAAVFAVGVCAAFFVLNMPFFRRFWLSFEYGVGVLIGMAATGGFWMYEMWTRFGNPLFPYFNLYFRSPMATIGDYRDTRFIPCTPGEFLISPFFFGVAPYKISELSFHDLRIPVLYILLLALLVFYVIRMSLSEHLTPDSDMPDQKFRFFLVAGILTYLTWLKMFAIFRYALTIELLTPLGIWLILERLIVRVRIRLIAAGAIFALILITMTPANWGRAPWGKDFFGANLPVIKYPDHTIILMTGTNPTSYLAPLFPPKIRFIRIQGYFTGPSSHPNGFDKLMQGIVAKHQGPMYVLYRSYEQAVTTLALTAYGLKEQKDSCRTFHPRIEVNEPYPLYLCQVSKEVNDEPK